MLPIYLSGVAAEQQQIILYPKEYYLSNPILALL
jgi:hypothetical protein